ncbi:MAG: hypothetical protein CSA10_00945 [Cardiobacteriales bacterium]|nr:MAG: hypothetical protein CSA10_00945 [Cardiobacteriales bacterium]
MKHRFLSSLKASLTGIRGFSLYLFQSPLWLALPISLFKGRLTKTVKIALVIILITYGAILTKRYFQAYRHYFLKTGDVFLEKDDRPKALILIALGVYVLVTMVIRRPILFGLIASIFASLGYYLRYMATDSKWLSDLTPERVPTDHLNPTLRDMLNNAYSSIEILENNARYLRQYPSNDNLSAKLTLINKKARNIIAMIADNPAKIRQMRTFLVIYLNQLQDISERYIVQLDMENESEKRQNLEQLLDDTLSAFDDQQLILTQSRQAQLDIRMQVLRDQLNALKANERKEF